MFKTIKFFLIIGMIFTFYLIYPVILGIISIKKLNRSKSVEDLRTWGIISLIFVNVIGGILMLCITQEELDYSRFGSRTYYPNDNNINNDTNKLIITKELKPLSEDELEKTINIIKYPWLSEVSNTDSIDYSSLEEQLKDAKSLYEKELISKDEYVLLKKNLIDKYSK